VNEGEEEKEADLGDEEEEERSLKSFHRTYI
jgi:hypothetical protein